MAAVVPMGDRTASTEMADDAHDPDPISRHEPGGAEDRTAPRPSGAVALDESSAGRVRLKHVQLLCPQVQLAANTTPEQMTRFVRDATRVASAMLAASRRKSSVLVQFNCTAAGHVAGIASHGSPGQDVLEGLHDAMEHLPPLPVTGEGVAFQLEFSVAAAPGSEERIERTDEQRRKRAGTAHRERRRRHVETDDSPTTEIDHWATRGNLPRVRLALVAGADVNAVDGSGATALHIAAKNGHNEIVALLLRHGADVNARGPEGETPADLAEAGGHTTIARRLRDAM